MESLVNKLSQKKLTGNRPASKTLRATMLSADAYRKLSTEDKKAWRQPSDVGKALFVKNVPTTVEDATQLRSAMKHETEDNSEDGNDNDESTFEREVKHLSIAQNDET